MPRPRSLSDVSDGVASTPVSGVIRILSFKHQVKELMNIISGFQWSRACGIAAVVLAGCANIPPPTEQMAVSKLAVANAVSAGGSEFAPVEMKSAQDRMDRANRAMGKEEYESARRLAEEAQADARLAEKIAHAGKARKAANVTQEDSRVLREEINRKNN